MAGLIGWTYEWPCSVIIAGGKKIAGQSPQTSPKNEVTKKVYSIGHQIYSVFNHKHFRIVCQIRPGSYWPVLFLTLIICIFRQNFVHLSFLPGRERAKWQGPDDIHLSPYWPHYKRSYFWSRESYSVWDSKVCFTNIPTYYIIYMWPYRKDLDGATSDADMRNHLEEVMKSSTDGIVGYKLSPKVFIIKTPVSALSPVGWVHVYRSDLGKIDCGLR